VYDLYWNLRKARRVRTAIQTGTVGQLLPTFQTGARIVNTSHKLIFCLLLSPFAAMANEPPEAGLDGLELVETTRTGHLYSNPDADWRAYTRINLDQVSIEFRKNWQRDQNRYRRQKVRAEDVDRIKAELASLFDDVFTRELSENGGYEIVTDTGGDVLMIRPSIVELDIAAPETTRAISMRSMTRDPGKMTLVLEIVDSVSGDVLEQAEDKQLMRDRYGYYQSNRVTNQAEAQQLLLEWARALRQRLDENLSGPTS
jgi:hypothetical protein